MVDSIPKFDARMMEQVIVVSINLPMAKVLLGILEEFDDAELKSFEYALYKRLQYLVDKGERIARSAGLEA